MRRRGRRRAGARWRSARRSNAAPASARPPTRSAPGRPGRARDRRPQRPWRARIRWYGRATVGSDQLQAGLSLIRAAGERGIALRLVGGLAVQALTPGYPARVRDGQDLDLAARGGDRRALTDL